jgi:hypothetical protein
MPGETLAIAVTLSTVVDVTDIRVSFALSPPLRFVTDALGDPLCSVDPQIDPAQSSFRLRCDVGEIASCTLHAHVFALDSDAAIADGTLYTCEVAIDADATPGDYALTCGMSGSSDANGDALSTACVDGAIDVSGEPVASPTPTATPLPPSPSPSPTAAASATATSVPSLTPTLSNHPRRADGGCRVSAPAEPAWAWLLSFVLPVLWARARAARPAAR